MNRFAFELSSYTMKTFSGLSRADVRICGKENVPEGSIIFTANHFTRIETVFLPYHIHKLTGKEVWSLAAADLFEVGVLKAFLENLGAVSTGAPDRDEIILKTLLGKAVQWIIFPEGMLVKNKKLIKNDAFTLVTDEAEKRPHTGAAILAFQCEFYRERLRRLKDAGEPEFDRLAREFEITDIQAVLESQTYIVPVNITYYPASPRENLASRIGQILMKDPSKRVMDELMTEGSLLFKDVDIDICFGKPIPIRPLLDESFIESMLSLKRRLRFDADVQSKQVIKDICVPVMEQYMGRVYDMTTLNYDHICACILKHFPYQKDGIDPYEFACKVFYAVQYLAWNPDVNTSRIFHYNQIHLLTDDRFARLEKFWDLARKTGVVESRNGRIFKDQTKFFLASGFHTIRMENPLYVIANEVEPMQQTEAFLKKTAQKSLEQIKQKVRQRLIEKIQVDFSTDYTRFYKEGESKRKRIGTPRLYTCDNPRAGILLIHGYMAAPEEMKPFARYLNSKGFVVYVPRLKGHGTSPEDLARVRHEDWIESVEEGLVILRHSCEKVILGGFSTGAGLALDLATRITDAAALFAVAPPMQLQDMGAYFVPAIDTWNTMIKKIRLAAAAKEYMANSPENPHINYLRNPISGIRELERLMVRLESRLKDISLPALVVQSRKDPVVNPKGTLSLFEKLGSEFKEYYIFDYDRHGVLLGDDVERVYSAIATFLGRFA